MKIGIGITTRNRRDVALEAWSNIKMFSPEAHIVVVDDASDVPFPYSDFRFDENVGISVAKNKCIELLNHCTDIFLFDDDCFPLNFSWHLFYVKSGLNHACYTFGRKVLNERDNFVEYEKPCGCMLYFKKKAIDIVGGFDTDFKTWGYEHCNVSDRIFNNGLTPARYIDIKHSNRLFFSMDEYGKTVSSVPFQDRINSIATNEKLYKEKFNSTEFKPYK